MSCQWMHCNFCFAMPSGSTRIGFHISNCGHVACDECVGKGQLSPICVRCKKNARTFKIERNMPEEIKAHFMNPYDVFEKTIRDMKTIVEFQSKNYSRLIKHKEQQILELSKQCEEHKGNLELVAELKKQNETLAKKQKELEMENENMSVSLKHNMSTINFNYNGFPDRDQMQMSFLTPYSQQDSFNLLNSSLCTHPQEREREEVRARSNAKRRLFPDEVAPTKHSHRYESSLTPKQLAFISPFVTPQKEPSFVEEEDTIPESPEFTPASCPLPQKRMNRSLPANPQSAYLNYVTPSRNPRIPATCRPGAALNMTSHSWAGFTRPDPANFSVRKVRSNPSVPSKHPYKRPVTTNGELKRPSSKCSHLSNSDCNSRCATNSRKK